jgi:hypothetical protein
MNTNITPASAGRLRFAMRSAALPRLAAHEPEMPVDFARAGAAEFGGFTVSP